LYCVVHYSIIVYMKYKEQQLAIHLRKNGLSYQEILSKIKISKSTLSLWLREIELTNKQKKRLLNKSEKIRYETAKKKVASRISKTKKIIERAKKEVRWLKNNPLFLIGTALYWAEGAKSSDEKVKLVNSDEKMIILMMKWFRKTCKVPEKKFRIQVHMHSLHSRKDILEYWSKITKVPMGQIYKPYIKQTSLGQRKNILYNGTCSIIVNDKNLFRRILGWKLGLQKYFLSPRSLMDRTEGF
jgi:transcriptional regulator with XRE-family HTH domain